ncbi:MAG TPA: hypothetical protein DF383_13075, partial [Deltaproteobacteria bacterium]|nr:hypothetical protein [Deltaproteobacteria bacterium]
MIAKALLEGAEHPEKIYPHWKGLEPFAQFILDDPECRQIMEKDAQRTNKMILRIREALLKKGYPDELLRQKGLDPEVLPR